MPDKFNRPQEPADALYHDVLCGDIERVKEAIRVTPELIKGKTVVSGAWSHGGRRCGAQEDVISCLQLLADNGAAFSQLGPGTFDSAFKSFPRAAELLFELGADATKASDVGNTGLHDMVAIGHQNACEVLLRHGADINAKNRQGRTPLDVAIEHKLPRLYDFLIQLGAKRGTSTCSRPDQPIERCVDVSAGRLSGEVVWYRADRGYGYLLEPIRGELFFDRDDISGDEPESIEGGTAVSFELTRDKFGRYATNVDFGSINHQLSAG